MNVKKKTCSYCPNEIEDGRDSYDHYKYLCLPCREREMLAQRERDLKSNRDAAAKVIKNLFPPRMEETNRTDPRFNTTLWKSVEEWKPTTDKPWLGLVGPSGKSKTRCAYERIADAVLATAEKECAGPLDPAYNGGLGGVSFSVAVIRAVDYAEAIRSQYNSDSEVVTEAHSLLKKAKTARWLLLDDLGKCTHTPAVASALFALIDHRHNENLVTIWTANTKPVEFLANIPSDLADPLRGRLLECSTTFQLK